MGHDDMTDAEKDEAVRQMMLDTHKKVEEYGWVSTAVFPDPGDSEPYFDYTTGLFQTYDHPELVVVGLSNAEITHSLLWCAIEAHVKPEGKNISVGPQYDGILQNLPVEFRPVRQEMVVENFGVTSRFYGRNDYEALQMVLPDKEGRFPWDDDFDADGMDWQQYWY